MAFVAQSVKGQSQLPAKGYDVSGLKRADSSFNREMLLFHGPLSRINTAVKLDRSVASGDDLLVVRGSKIDACHRGA